MLPLRTPRRKGGVGKHKGRTADILHFLVKRQSLEGVVMIALSPRVVFGVDHLHVVIREPLEDGCRVRGAT